MGASKTHPLPLELPVKTFFKTALFALGAYFLGPVTVLPFLLSTLRSMRNAHARFLSETYVIDLERIGHLAPMITAAAEKALAEQDLGHLEVVFCQEHSKNVSASVVRIDDRAFIGLSSSALTLVASDPEEFAALLAHEVAHVAFDHTRKRRRVSTTVLTFLALATPLASYLCWGSGTALGGATLMFVLAFLALGYFVPWMNRRFELEADARARDLGHARGLCGVLNRAELEEENPAPPVAKGLESHPSVEARLARLG
jgi:Zn-dependent protease with chaperone function